LKVVKKKDIDPEDKIISLAKGERGISADLKYLRFQNAFFYFVIPAKAGIQYYQIFPRFPRIKYGAGSVKPGMTKCIGYCLLGEGVFKPLSKIEKCPYKYIYL